MNSRQNPSMRCVGEYPFGKSFCGVHHSSFRIHHSPSAFVLLEVLVSLTILSVSLVMVLQSFTNSMKASRHSRNLTVATTLARGLLEKWELTPPPKGESRGDFGLLYPGFSYNVNHRTEVVDYEGVSRMVEAGRLVELRRVSLGIWYAPERNTKRDAPKKLLQVETALTGSERFTFGARISNKIGFED